MPPTVVATLAVLCAGLISVSAESGCKHEHTPNQSMCTGCPPMFNGKMCASTTRYNDLTKGAQLDTYLFTLQPWFCETLSFFDEVFCS